MLSEISLITMAFLTPFFCFLSFRWGYRYGSDGVKASETKITPQICRKKYKMPPEVKKINQELKNIENYTGDSTGQVKL